MIIVELKITRYCMGKFRSSLMLINGELIAEGAAKIVWMNTLNGKPVPIPDHLRAMLDTA